MTLAETDSFISEVSEEVRRDRLYAFLRRWGWLIAAVLILIVGGAALNEWRKHRTEQAAEAAGDALRMAMLIDDPVARAAALAPLADAGDGSSVVASFARAGALLASGEKDGAAEILAAVVVNPSAVEPWRSLASLQRVMILGDGLPASERLGSLETLTATGAPFRLLALEQRALVYLDEGNLDAAAADLEAILDAPDVTEGLAGRARQLLIASGAPLPVEGTGADG